MKVSYTQYQPLFFFISYKNIFRQNQRMHKPKYVEQNTTDHYKETEGSVLFLKRKIGIFSILDYGRQTRHSWYKGKVKCDRSRYTTTYGMLQFGEFCESSEAITLKISFKGYQCLVILRSFTKCIVLVLQLELHRSKSKSCTLIPIPIILPEWLMKNSYLRALIRNHSYSDEQKQ